jgi:hypothetical protein
LQKIKKLKLYLKICSKITQAHTFCIFVSMIIFSAVCIVHARRIVQATDQRLNNIVFVVCIVQARFFNGFSQCWFYIAKASSLGEAIGHRFDVTDTSWAQQWCCDVSQKKGSSCEHHDASGRFPVAAEL